MKPRLLAVVAALPLLAACGGETGAGTDDPPSLPEGQFVATDLPAPFGPGDELRVRVAGGELSFRATCNSMSGNAAVADGVLVVDSVGGTEMGCEDPGFAQDEWLVDFFTSRPTVDTLDVGYVLRGERAEVRLLPPDAVPGEDDVPLVGTRWLLTGVEERDGDSVGMMPVPERLGAGVEIVDATIGFETGCNAAGGEVTVQGDRLRLRGVAITLRGCSGLRQEVEQAQVPLVMAKRLAWSVDGDQLRLTRGGTSLLYRADPQG